MSYTILPGIENLLNEAVNRRASDIHLQPGEPPALRVDGVIERMEGDPLSADEITEIAAAAVGEEELHRIGREVGEVHRALNLSEEFSGRVAVARSGGEYTISIRLLPISIPNLEAIRFPQAMLDAAGSPHGLVIISGPTGSGKSTAAFSLLEHINAHSPGHICTIEDPIQYRLFAKKALVQQREVGSDVPDTVAGIQASLRQDPDVIFIGELKSVEELEASIAAAELGHLFIIVLHASTPEDALQRLMDIFPEEVRDVSRKALARVLRGVSAQVLLPAKDKPGRTVAYGVLIPDDEMRAAIVEGRDVLARRSPLPEGCRTLDQDIERLANEGKVSQEVADRYRGRM